MCDFCAYKFYDAIKSRQIYLDYITVRNIYACKVNKGNAIVIKCYKIWNSREFTKIHMIMDFVISLLITKWLIRWFTLQFKKKKVEINVYFDMGTWTKICVTLSHNERYIKKWYGFENKCVNNDFPLNTD